MKLQESAEMYLETILILQRRGGTVRAIDIAAEMGFSKPSVSVAMKQLRENNLIEIDAAGSITLTGQGRDIASSVYERHRLLTEYLVSIGVSHEIAEQDACKIEHVLSQETFERLKDQAEKRNLKF